MDQDLTELLKNWPPEAGQVNARCIEAADGRPIIQVRIELGILQMEATGRPDGQRPEGYASLLECHRDRFERYLKQNGSELGFVLSSEESKALRDEAVLYYHRYVAMFALGDYEAVIRDTTRNLKVISLCRRFGATEADRSVLDRIRPSVIMMRTRAEAEIAVAQQLPKQALAVLDRGLEEIRHAFEDAGLHDVFDHANEVHLLRGMRDMLVPKLPSSQRAEMQDRIQAAIDAENFELAAILRDELKMMVD